jgi:hypothetical protein
MVLKFLGSNRWLVEPQCSIERLTRRRALVGLSKKQQQHQKQKPFEGKTMKPRGDNAIRVPKKSLTPPTSS